jgi:hypothetical protein
MYVHNVWQFFCCIEKGIKMDRHTCLESDTPTYRAHHLLGLKTAAEQKKQLEKLKGSFSCDDKLEHM